MTKRALSAVAGFLALCLPLFAQQTPGPGSIQLDAFTLKQLGWVWEAPSAVGHPAIFQALNNSFFSLPSLTLSDGRLFSFFSAALAWIETLPADVSLPTIIVKAPQSATASTSMTYSADSSKEVVDVRRSNSYYAGGEVGALYGRSSGKYGVEVEKGYIIGEVGDDKFNITAGASYERSTRHR